MTPSTPLAPKVKGAPLRVFIPGRISTAGQDVRNIDATQAEAEAWLGRAYRGAVEVTRDGEQASGWLADRDSMVRLGELMQAGEVDLVLVTELREVYRNPAFLWAFVHSCIDAGVRFVAFADAIDTADENWEVMMHAAAMRHGMEVPTTRRRVRRTADHSFSRGGMVLKVKYGYRKLSRVEAESGESGTVGLRIAKLENCTEVIREMARRVRSGESYVAVADWLNAEGVVPGPYAECGTWTGKLVKELLRDPVLSGRRTFRVTVNRMSYKTGKHRQERNTAGPEEREYPELAHLTEAEHAALLEAMDRRREGSKASQRCGEASPLWRRPRKRSAWPGQHATCGVCGGKMYRYGKFLRCENTLANSARECWNHVQVEIAQVHSKVIPWAVSILERNPAFRPALVRSAWSELERCRKKRSRSTGVLDAEVGELEAKRDRLVRAITLGGELESLVAELSAVEGRLAEARLERERSAAAGVGSEFRSAEEVDARLGEVLVWLAAGSPDFADVFRRLLPKFVVRPVQQLDTPQVRPRGELTLSMAAWTAAGEEAFEESVSIDLFDPPVHVANLRRCLAAKEASPKLTLEKLAASLGVNRMTVKRALDYSKRMKAADIDDPYVILTEKPADASRWKKRSPNEE